MDFHVGVVCADVQTKGKDPPVDVPKVADEAAFFPVVHKNVGTGVSTLLPRFCP
jgi:hypothetical protein